MIIILYQEMDAQVLAKEKLLDFIAIRLVLKMDQSVTRVLKIAKHVQDLLMLNALSVQMVPMKDL